MTPERRRCWSREVGPTAQNIGRFGVAMSEGKDDAVVGRRARRGIALCGDELFHGGYAFIDRA